MHREEAQKGGVVAGSEQAVSGQGAAEERPAKSQSRCGGGAPLDHNRLRYGGVAVVEAQQPWQSGE